MPTGLYALIDRRLAQPGHGQPFYIGIGTQDRMSRHLRMARGRRHFNAAVQEIFDGHRAEGVWPEFRMLAVCPDKEYAGLVEKRAIAVYGRRGIDLGGILCNVASGGQGPDSSIMQLVKGDISASMKERWKDPAKADACARSLAALEATRGDPRVTALRSEASRKHSTARWADPKKAAQMKAAMKGNKKTISPEALEQRRIALAKALSGESAEARHTGNKRRWENPEFRAKRSQNQAAAWADPEKRERMLAGRSRGIADSWNDPEVRARRIEGIKAAAARKRNIAL